MVENFQKDKYEHVTQHFWDITETLLRLGQPMVNSWKKSNQWLAHRKFSEKQIWACNSAVMRYNWDTAETWSTNGQPMVNQWSTLGKIEPMVSTYTELKKLVYLLIFFSTAAEADCSSALKISIFTNFFSTAAVLSP